MREGCQITRLKCFFQVSLKLGRQEIKPKEDSKVADCSVFAYPYSFQKQKMPLYIPYITNEYSGTNIV